MLRDLIFPVLGNHNATLFLLGHTLNSPHKYSLVMSPTDVVADAVVSKLCNWLGVETVAISDLSGREFRRVYAHPWNTEGQSLSEISFEELWIFADGLSNRVMMDEWPAADGFLFWGPVPPFDPGKEMPGVRFQMSSLETQRLIWSKILEFTGLPTRQNFVSQLEGSALVAMRYWGSATYSNLSHFFVQEALGQFRNFTDAKDLFLKRDSRWVHPISQSAIVSRSFPNCNVKVLSNTRMEQARLGHLASLDTYLFTCDFPKLDFLGFDGSLPPTVLATQGAVEVFVPDMSRVMSRDLPIQAVVLENLDWHRAIKVGEEPWAHGGELLNSLSLKGAIAESRGLPIQGDAHLGRIVKSLLFSMESNLDASDLERLRRGITREELRRERPSRVSGLIVRVKGSRFAMSLYYQAARYLPLRRIMVSLSRLLKF
jgi:hypothetical protein